MQEACMNKGNEVLEKGYKDFFPYQKPKVLPKSVMRAFAGFKKIFLKGAKNCYK